MPDAQDLIGRCPNCQAPIPRNHPYAWCSRCGNGLPVDVQAQLGVARQPENGPPPPRLAGMRVLFRTFTSSFQSWDTLFAEAAEFASKVGRERLINISHSADQNQGVVTVWYWA